MHHARHPAHSETLTDIPQPDTCPTCRTLRVIVNDLRAEKRAWMAERGRLEQQIAHFRSASERRPVRWWRR